jgi:hypothetical protein
MGGKLVLGLCAGAILIIQSAAFSKTWENWNDMSCAIKLDQKTSFEIYNRTKFQKALFTKTYLTGIQAGLSRRIDANLIALLAYRYEINNKIKYYEFENRFLLQFSYKIPIKKYFIMQIAQRTELRYFTRTTHDNVRLRASLNISRKFPIHKQVIAPYLTGELFYNTYNNKSNSNDNKLNRKRIYLGILYNLNNKYAIKLGWIRQLDKGKDALDILNTGMNLSF